ncbi:MAG: GNAT family N-acetyltransferase [Actinomycetota bacterium]
MSIEVRRAESDADLEAFIRIRRTLLPNESGGSVELFRAQMAEKPERRLLVAEFDREVVGSGLVDRSDIGDRFSVKVRVLPSARRRGVGTALLRELVAHASTFGHDRIATHVEEEGSLPFAERFGFRETDRQVEQVKHLDEEPTPRMPDGIEVVTVADRPSLLRDAYPLASEGYHDMALEAPAQLSIDDWLREEATIPEGSFVALADGEIVGFSGLVRHDNPGVAEDGLTVVRRDWRRRGLASLLKRLELAWAADHGFREVVTWTQRGNDGMRRVNELLGYEYRDITITMVAAIPLKGLD